jgi:hypothetical protein
MRSEKASFVGGGETLVFLHFLEEEKMRRFALILAIVAMISAPSFAALGPVYKITPNAGGGYGQASRPAVCVDTAIGDQIVWSSGPYAVGATAQGSRYQALVGPEVNVALFSGSLGWAPWSIEVGVSQNYAVYGGPPSLSGQALNVERLSDGLIIPVALAAGDGNDDHHFTDVNNNGDVIWGAWDNTVRHVNVSGGVAGPMTTIVNTPLANPGWRMRLSRDSDRVAIRMDNSGPPSPIDVYDLGDAMQYNILTPAVLGGALGTQKPYKAEISEDGNFVVSNVRYTGTGNNNSDIVLVDITNIAAPVQYNLTGDNATDPGFVRNDPAISMLDADTALLVWDENAAGNNDVVGAFVTGLAPGGAAPTLGTQFTISELGIHAGENQHYADVSGLLVAWKNDSTGEQQYRYIPEPASLSLLALGGLALLRRR